LVGTATTDVGAPGAVGAAGVTGLDGAEAGPVPTALMAVTVKVYVRPFVSPPIAALVAGGLPETTVGGNDDEPVVGVTL
jgi:hypothetical protein